MYVQYLHVRCPRVAATVHHECNQPSGLSPGSQHENARGPVATSGSSLRCPACSQGSHQNPFRRRADYTTQTHTHLRFPHTPSYIALHRIQGTHSWVLLCANTPCGKDMVLPACPCSFLLRFESPIAGRACMRLVHGSGCRESAQVVRYVADCPTHMYMCLPVG